MALLAHWKFDDDYTEEISGYDAGVGAGTPSFVQWREQKALSLDVSEYVENTSDASSLIGLTAGVISCWFRTTAVSVGNEGVTLFCLSQSDSNNLVRLQVGNATGSYSNEAMNFLVTDNGTGVLRNHVLQGVDNWNDGLWHHVAWITDGTSNHWLIDGTAYSGTFAIGSGTTLALTNITEADQILFGGGQWNSNSLTGDLGCDIADLRIYDAALTDQQILDQLFKPYVDLYWTESSLTGPYTDATVKSAVTITDDGDATVIEDDYDTYQYRHHVRLFWKAGVTYCMHSCGAQNEDANGQVTIGWRSTDKGATWSGQDVVLGPQSPFSATAPSNTDGSFFSFPAAFSVVNGTLYGVTALQEWVSGERVTHAYIAQEWGSSGVVGSPFRITAASYTPHASYSAIAYDGTLGPLIYTEASQRFHWGPGIYENVIDLSEPTTFDLGAGNLIRLWRGVTSGYTLQHWTEVSYDSGVSWLGPFPTGIPNFPSASAGIADSQGRTVIVGNPRDSGDAEREPLFLAIGDGGNHQDLDTVLEVVDGTAARTFTGTHKGIGYQYPDIIQVGNYYYIAYSVSKERVQFVRMLVPGLTDDDGDVTGADFYGHLYSVQGVVRAARYQHQQQACLT